MNIADLFSNLNYNNYSQIKQNPTSVVRTPIQEAYDNLLNREYEINKQNKTNNLVNGLMSGMGGLGKIIASSVVKNPMQQYGAMKGLTEQEGRIDNLQQAYNQARQKQNQDYVQQAKEQLGLATAEDERNYNRDRQRVSDAYKRVLDDRNQANIDRQWANTLEQQDIANQFKQDELNFKKEQLKEGIRQFNETMGYNREKADAEALLKQQEEQQKQQAEEEKKRTEKIKSVQSLLGSFNSAGSIEPKDYLELMKVAEQDPDKVLNLLQDSGNYKESGLILGFLPWKTAGNKNKFKADISLDNKNIKGL